MAATKIKNNLALKLKSTCSKPDRSRRSCACCYRRNNFRNTYCYGRCNLRRNYCCCNLQLRLLLLALQLALRQDGSGVIRIGLKYQLEIAASLILVTDELTNHAKLV